MNNPHVVIEDPEGKFWEGELVDGQRVNELHARGVALLPVHPELFKLSGVGGFSKRSWGKGESLDGFVPRIVCPLTIHTLGDPFRSIHWAARLEGKPGQGIARIAADAGRGNMARAVVADDRFQANAVDIAKLGRPDPAGGWTVYGRANLHVPGEGFYGLGLYGFAPGMRVVWLAATVTQ